MTKHSIEIDAQTLGAARAELGTHTIKDTVHEALRRAGCGRRSRVSDALDTLAEAMLDDRVEGWRIGSSRRSRRRVD